jgi:NADPH:quinone reductase-like Zn-dependent oxidoreductase
MNVRTVPHAGAASYSVGMFATSVLVTAMIAVTNANCAVMQLDDFGLDHLVIVKGSLTQLQPSEVRLRARAASPNFLDLLVARNQFADRPRKIKVPLVAVSDCAGEVVEIGSAVERLENR